MRSLTGLLLCLALFPACDEKVEEIADFEQIEVAGYLVACQGVGAQLCTMERGAGEAEFSYGYDGIIGFTWQWSHEYVLEVSRREVVPQEDGSSIETRLERVVSDQPMAPGTPFSWSVRGCQGCTPHLTVTGETGGELMDGTPFTCDATVCADLDSKLEGDVEVDFELVSGEPLLLRVTAVR